MTDLGLASTKLQWCNAVVNRFNGARTVSIISYPTQADADAETNGVVAVTGSNSGNLASVAASIIDLGTLENITFNQPIDLNVGVNVLKIEINGYFIQGTIGLAGSDCDWIASENPADGKGLGFMNISISPPVLMPSGLGAAAPMGALPETPKTVELHDWTDPANPVLVGSLTFNDRKPDLVFDNPDMQAAAGDIGVTQSTESIIFGEFEFGATLFTHNAGLNEDDPTKPVYQVLIGCKPYGTWATYPAMDTFDPAVNVTFPQPFKMVIKTMDGTVAHTHEMSDGLPINSPAVSMVRSDTTVIRPWFNCWMMLPWESAKMKMSVKATKFFPGVVDDAMRPSQATFADAVNGPFLLMNGNGTQLNATAHWKAAPEWPMDSSDNNYAINDPYLIDINGTYTGGVGSPTRKSYRAIGWNYEPGSVSCHDWYTGPGGPRFDRAFIPTVLAYVVTNPTGVRAQGNVSYRDLARAWNLAYFNHSHHQIRDVKTLETLPDEQVINSEWSHTHAYYGGLTTYVAGGTTRHVDIRSLSSGGTTAGLDTLRDKNGHLPFDGWGMDYLHNYCQPGWATLLFNSGMHLVSAKYRHHNGIMCQLGDVRANKDPNGWFLTRQHSWRWLHASMMWALSTNHPLGIRRDLIEGRWQQEMEAIYDYVVVPATDPNHPNYNSLANQAWRNFGMTVKDNIKIDGTHQMWMWSSALTFYTSHALQFMKVTGSWDAMRAKSAKCAAALDFIIKCMDTYSIDFILDTDGRAEAYIVVSETVPTSTPITSIPSSWADWAATIHPKTGVEDWITDPDGTARVYERDNTQHLRAQYAFIRRDYFPEIPNARLAAACAKYQDFYDRVAARVAAASAGTKSIQWNQCVADWHYRIPSHAIFKPPVV